MSPLEQSMRDYLQLRRSLGYDLAEAHWLLPSFVSFLDAQGATTVTVQTALAWVQQSPGRGGLSVAPRRMTAVRGFARYLAGTDPATEIPPLGLVPHRQRWRPTGAGDPAQAVRQTHRHVPEQHRGRCAAGST